MEGHAHAHVHRHAYSKCVLTFGYHECGHVRRQVHADMHNPVHKKPACAVSLTQMRVPTIVSQAMLMIKAVL